MPRPPRATAALAASALLWAAVTAVAGCGGSSADPGGPTVTVRATSEFGRDTILSEEGAPLSGHRTVLRALEGYAKVGTIFDGSNIESIDDRYTQSLPYATAWSIVVNGIEADEGPNTYELHPGDVAQADLRYWETALDVRATVGAFPQTFTRGVYGRRFPVTVRCERPSSPACGRVERALERAGVATDGSPPGGRRPARGQPRRAVVLVGRWDRWRDRPWPARIDEGPEASGVFARFTPSGDAIELLDWQGRPVRSEGAGAGLVAAMRPTEHDLLWLVTGVDQHGVDHASRALTSPNLHGAFAAIATATSLDKIPLPPR